MIHNILVLLQKNYKKNISNNFKNMIRNYVLIFLTMNPQEIFYFFY